MEAQKETADMGYRTYTYTWDRNLETENQWLTIVRVALAWTGTLKMMYLREAAKNILRGGVPQSHGLRPQSTDPP